MSASSTWKTQGLNVQVNDAGREGTSAEGEIGQKLMVVSFVHWEQEEKQGKYDEYETRRVKRDLQTLTLKNYVNTIFEGEFHLGTVPITFSDQDLETVELPYLDPLII